MVDEQISYYKAKQKNVTEILHIMQLEITVTQLLSFRF